MDDLLEIGAFSESGRGLPFQLSRPGGALPYSPLVRQAYAPTPRARIGWPAGLIEVREVALDDPSGVRPDDDVRVVARRLHEEDGGWVAVLDGERFLGVVFSEAILGCVAADRFPVDVRPLVSEQIPTCVPSCALVDAVRQMLASYFRRIPVIGGRGELVGILPLAAAAQAQGRDPAVRDLVESATASIFARPWR